jgi:hypothetical protein
MWVSNDTMGTLIPPENFVGRLKAAGREVEVDPSITYECKMAGVGNTVLPHTRAGLHALQARVTVALRELRMALGEFYPDPDKYGSKYCLGRLEKVDARVAADISKAASKIKENE